MSVNSILFSALRSISILDYFLPVCVSSTLSKLLIKTDRADKFSQGTMT